MKIGHCNSYADVHDQNFGLLKIKLVQNFGQVQNFGRSSKKRCTAYDPRIVCVSKDQELNLREVDGQ